MIVATLSACTKFNGTPLESTLGKNENLITYSYALADQLVASAFPPLMPRHPEMPILTTTFVNNNDLKQTSRFGRVIQEHLTSRLTQLGYTVKETKLQNTMSIEPRSGETMLSRHLHEINASQSPQAIVVGTYSYTDRTMYITTRLVNPATSNIIASVDKQLVMDENVLAMFGLQTLKSSDPEMIAAPGESMLNSVLY